jgi:hypothetical protein
MNFKFLLPKWAPKHYPGLSVEELRKRMIGTVGDLTWEEVQSIVDIIGEYESPNYLEIGVNYGATFFYIVENTNVKKAVGVDLFEKLEEYLIKNEDNTHRMWTEYNGTKFINTATTEELYSHYKGDKNLEFHASDSNHMLNLLNDKFDVIFIDGNHTYNQTKIDFENSFKVSEKNTSFIFHNATNHLSPDKAYVEVDGGPWKVCEELRVREDMVFRGYFDRCAIFQRKG